MNPRRDTTAALPANPTHDPGPTPRTAVPMGHWGSMARLWAQIGSPLRPSSDDVAAYSRFVLEWIDRHEAPRVLLLGVTPELYKLPWPSGRDFVAVDNTRTMIEQIWPGERHEVLEAAWLDLPLPAASRDIALCDGGLHLLDYPLSQHRLAMRLHDVLVPGGRCIIRLFTPPAHHESAATVIDDLLGGRIENLNVLKLRLGMAIQDSPEGGVEVRKILQALLEGAGALEPLAERLGWSIEHLGAINAYRDSQSRYYFISAEQAEEVFCTGGKFVRGEKHISGYALGDRCPIVVFERK